MGNQAAKEHRNRSSSKKNVHWEEAERPHPPGQPVLVPPSAAGGEHPDVVTIRWDPPISDGGCPITGYIVSHRRTGSPHWVRSTTKLVHKPPVTVSGLEPGWRYQFRVVAENSAGRSDPSPLSEPLTVTLARGTPIAAVAPHFSKELHNCAALENDKIELVVRVSGTPLPRVSWFKDSLELVSGRRTRVWSEGDEAELTSTLTIFQAALSDEGLIKCTATNRVGHAVTKANLRIEAPPAVRLPRQYEEGLLFQLGEIIRVKVTLAGRPPPRVTWMHNGEEMKSDPRKEMVHNDRSASLKITNARRGDRGEYLVRASNQLGEDSAAFLVTVTDRPTPPGKATISMTLGRSVTLTWTPPEDDGGCKIGNYVVEYFRVGWNMWLKGATCRQLTTTISDLIEGSEYKFRIKAENPYGVSDPGEESDKLFIPDPKRRILDPSDGNNTAPVSSWWDKPEPPLSPTRTRREDTPTESRPSRADSITIKTPAANRGSSLPRPPDRPPRGRTPDPPKRRNRSLSRGRKSKSPEPSDQEIEMGIVKGRLFGINVSSDNVVLRSHENVGIEQVVYTEANSRRSSISSSKEKLESRRSKEQIDEEDRRKIIDNLNAVKDPATLIQEMRKEFVEYVKGRNRADQTTKDKEKIDAEEINGGIATKSEHQPREHHDRIASEGDSSEFLLVLLPNSRGTTEERDLSRSETERALKSPEPSVPPPMSLSAPELGAIEPDVPFMRNAVSSTELLHERAMARFYQEAAQEEAEKALKRRMTVERRVSLERKLSIERKNREQARMRARMTSAAVDENDEEDFIPSNMKRFAGARPSNASFRGNNSPNLYVNRQIPSISISQEMTAEEKEESEFAELRRRLSESNSTARVEERRRLLLEADSEDLEEEEEEEAEEEEEDDERELDGSDEEMETYHPRMVVGAPPGASATLPVDESRPTPTSYSVNTYRPTLVSLPASSSPPTSRYNTYTTTTEDDNAPSTLLTKRHSPSKGDVKPKPILKKRNSLKKERTNTPSPPTKKLTPGVPSPIKKIAEKLKTPELPKTSETSTDSNASDKKPTFKLFKSKSKQTEDMPSRNSTPVKLRSKPIRMPDQTPPSKRHSISRLQTNAPEEELGVSAAEAAKVKRGITRKEPLKDEETKTVISHYSDIVREFGAAHKPHQAKYLTYEELKEKAESLEREKQMNNSTPNRRMSRASSREGRLSVSSSRDFSVTRSHSSIASSLSDARSLSPEAQIMAQQAEKTVRSALSYMTDVCIFLLAVWLFLFENELFAIPVLLLLAYRQIEEWVKKRAPNWLSRRLKRTHIQKNHRTTNSLR